VSVCGPSRICFEPLKLLNFDFNADLDLDLAFNFNADPDPASKKSVFRIRIHLIRIQGSDDKKLKKIYR
jgi:hypothetical protein